MGIYRNSQLFFSHDSTWFLKNRLLGFGPNTLSGRKTKVLGDPHLYHHLSYLNISFGKNWRVKKDLKNIFSETSGQLMPQTEDFWTGQGTVSGWHVREISQSRQSHVPSEAPLVSNTAETLLSLFMAVDM